MSNSFEEALENMAALTQQSAAVNASTAENLQTIGAKVVEHDKEIEEINTKMTEYDDEFKDIHTKFREIEDNEYVNPTQQAVMREHATARVIQLLGTEKGSGDWIVFSKTFYFRLWSSFKRRFAIPKYAWLRRVDYQIGLDIIDGWIPDGGIQELKDEVIRMNTLKEKEHLKAVFRAKDEMDGEDK